MVGSYRAALDWIRFCIKVSHCSSTPSVFPRCPSSAAPYSIVISICSEKKLTIFLQPCSLTGYKLTAAGRLPPYRPGPVPSTPMMRCTPRVPPEPAVQSRADLQCSCAAPHSQHARPGGYVRVTRRSGENAPSIPCECGAESSPDGPGGSPVAQACCRSLLRWAGWGAEWRRGAAGLSESEAAWPGGPLQRVGESQTRPGPGPDAWPVTQALRTIRPSLSQRQQTPTRASSSPSR